MAVKILIKHKFKNGNMRAASRFLINNRTGAMQQPGYISSETLRSLDDQDQVMVVSMWENMEAWGAWKNSETHWVCRLNSSGSVLGDAHELLKALVYPFLKLETRISSFCVWVERRVKWRLKF